VALLSYEVTTKSHNTFAHVMDRLRELNQQDAVVAEYWDKRIVVVKDTDKGVLDVLRGMGATVTPISLPGD